MRNHYTPQETRLKVKSFLLLTILTVVWFSQKMVGSLSRLKVMKEQNLKGNLLRKVSIENLHWNRVLRRSRCIVKYSDTITNFTIHNKVFLTMATIFWTSVLSCLRIAHHPWWFKKIHLQLLPWQLRIQLKFKLRYLKQRQTLANKNYLSSEKNRHNKLIRFSINMWSLHAFV